MSDRSSSPGLGWGRRTALAIAAGAERPHGARGSTGGRLWMILLATSVRVGSGITASWSILLASVSLLLPPSRTAWAWVALSNMVRTRRAFANVWSRWLHACSRTFLALYAAPRVS